MSGGHIGCDAELTENFVHADFRHTERRLGDVGDGDFTHRLRLFGFAEPRGRIHVVAEAFGQAVGKQDIGAGESGAQFRKQDREVAHHVGALRTLTGKQEGDFVGRGAGAAGEINATRVFDRRAAAADLLHRAGQFVAQVGDRFGDDGEAERTLPALLKNVIGDITQRRRRLQRGQRAQRCTRLLGHLFGRTGLPDEQFAGPCLEGKIGLGVIGGVFFQHGVKIGAAESKRVHPGATDAAPCDPRAGFGVDIHGALRIAHHVGRRTLHIDRRGQHLVVQRERGLDQTSDTGTAFGVADVGFHRTDSARLGGGAGFGHRDRHALGFGAVTEHGAGAVGFDQLDRADGKSGHVVGVFQRAQLAGRAGRGQAFALAVARAADAADDRVNAIAVLLREVEAFEDQRADAFADADAVGRLVKRTRHALRTERLGFGKTEESVRIHQGVGRANDRGGRLTAGDFAHADVDRGQCGRAGCVDGEIRAAEVQAVRDAPGHHVRQHAGERVFRPFRQLLQNIFRHALHKQGQTGAETITQPEVAHAAGEAVDAGGVFAVKFLVRVSGVGEGAGGGFEGKELDRVDRLQTVRRNAEFHGIKQHRVDKPAPLGVNFVARAFIGIEIVLPVPAVGRHFRDAIAFGQDVFPEGPQIASLGKHATHADDGDAGGRDRPGNLRRCFFRLLSCRHN